MINNQEEEMLNALDGIMKSLVDLSEGNIPNDDYDEIRGNVEKIRKMGITLLDKEELENIICYKTQPVYVGHDLKGYFIDKESLLKLMEILSVNED